MTSLSSWIWRQILPQAISCKKMRLMKFGCNDLQHIILKNSNVYIEIQWVMFDFKYDKSKCWLSWHHSRYLLMCSLKWRHLHSKQGRLVSAKLDPMKSLPKLNQIWASGLPIASKVKQEALLVATWKNEDINLPFLYFCIFSTKQLTGKWSKMDEDFWCHN